MKLISFILLSLIIVPISVNAETGMTITYRSNESTKDSRYDYDYEVLKLALEKTKKKYGAYQLQASPPMNFSRAFKELKSNNLKNFIIKTSYEDFNKEQGFEYARFPVDLGIVGYRICFTSKKNIEKIKNIKEFEQLKKLNFVQGAAWADVKILRNAGLNVTENVEYESLFTVTALGRTDLFCRGANEILSEYENHKNIPDFTLDESILIYYDLPRVFYGNKSSSKELKRIEEGLKLAHADGSLLKLWEKEYGKSIHFAKLGQRKKFVIENPLIRNIDFDYKKYYANPLDFK